MPNGDEFDRAEFDELESFIRPLDGAIAEFVRRIGAKLDVHYHNMPNRHVRFETRRQLQGQIEVTACYLDQPQRSGCACLISATAWKDYAWKLPYPEAEEWRRVPNRKLWHCELARWTVLPESMDEFVRTLEAGYAALQQLEETELR